MRACTCGRGWDTWCGHRIGCPRYRTQQALTRDERYEIAGPDTLHQGGWVSGQFIPLGELETLDGFSVRGAVR